MFPHNNTQVDFEGSSMKSQKSWTLPMASHHIKNEIYTLQQALQGPASSGPWPLALSLPQALCTCCYHFLVCSSPRSLLVILPHFIQGHLVTNCNTNQILIHIILSLFGVFPSCQTSESHLPIAYPPSVVVHEILINTQLYELIWCPFNAWSYIWSLQLEQ